MLDWGELAGKRTRVDLFSPDLSCMYHSRILLGRRREIDVGWEGPHREILLWVRRTRITQKKSLLHSLSKRERGGKIARKELRLKPHQFMTVKIRTVQSDKSDS